jgi:hypothetical protein
MIVIPALTVVLLLIAFFFNGDRYGVVATVIGSSVATIFMCAMFFDWAARHHGGSFQAFTFAFQLRPVGESSPIYLLGWLLVIIAFTALLLVPIRIIHLPKSVFLSYLAAWISGLGVLLLWLNSVASTHPALQFFLKFYSSDRVASLLPKDDASFQGLVHIFLPLVYNPVVQLLFTAHLAWIGCFFYLIPFAILMLRLSFPALGEAKVLQLTHYVSPITLFFIGIIFLNPLR